MKKRGQIQGEFFRYFLVVFAVAFMVIMGIVIINKLRSTSCTASMEVFKEDLKNSVKELHGDLGSISEEDLQVPCGVEKVYFVDLDKDTTKLSTSLTEYPLLQDAIASNTGQNVFLIKEDQVVESFYAGDIELQKPYYVCSETDKRDLDLYLGGRGTSTEVINKECAFDCTFEVIEINDSVAEELIQDAIDFGCGGCPQGTLEEEMEAFENTDVKIARRCNCGRVPGETVVEILIKPEGTVEHFKLIEKIPKGYVDNLEDYLDSMEGNYSYYKILWDPLIMWHFDEITEDTIVRYTIDKDIFEYCAEAFKTVGLAVTSESEGIPEEDLDVIPVEIPEMDPLGEVLIPPNTNNYHAFQKPIWQYLNASDQTPNVKKSHTYEISIDPPVDSPPADSTWGSYAEYVVNPLAVGCEIRPNDLHVICETGDSTYFTDSKTFHIRVLVKSTDEEIDRTSFTVSPYVCGIHTDSTPCNLDSNCEWCGECDGNRYSGDITRCVDTGTCEYQCTNGQCSATCTNSDDCTEEVERCENDRYQTRTVDCTDPSCGCVYGSWQHTGTDANNDGVDEECVQYTKLRCTTPTISGCSSRSVSYRCQAYDRGVAGGCCDCCDWYDFCDESNYYYCYDDWETECLENPECVDGIQVGEPIDCDPVCTDNDGDGYGLCPNCDIWIGCTYDGSDCDDSSPNAGNIFPGSTNPYCDCDANTGGGVTAGVPETGSLCFDGIDNDCDGTIDGCTKLRCQGDRDRECVEGCDEGDCDHFSVEWNWNGESRYAWPLGGCAFGTPWVCECEYNSWTECSSNPTCPEYTTNPTGDENKQVCEPTCSDGTPYDQCSTQNPGKKCENGELKDKCNDCPCEEGYGCQGQTCISTTCSDGTPDGQCSTQNPGKICDKGELKDRCNECTCSIEYTCQGQTCICSDDDDDEYTDEACGGDDCNDEEDDINPGEDEECNNIDDNCNGQIDENFADLGNTCTVGVGACAASGDYVCNGDGSGTECSATPGTPASGDFTCDGVDDDCNGQEDEDYVPQTTNCGVGACSATGSTSCNSGGNEVDSLD